MVIQTVQPTKLSFIAALSATQENKNAFSRFFDEYGNLQDITYGMPTYLGDRKKTPGFTDFYDFTIANLIDEAFESAHQDAEFFEIGDEVLNHFNYLFAELTRARSEIHTAIQPKQVEDTFNYKGDYVEKLSVLNDNALVAVTCERVDGKEIRFAVDGPYPNELSAQMHLGSVHDKYLKGWRESGTIHGPVHEPLFTDTPINCWSCVVGADKALFTKVYTVSKAWEILRAWEKSGIGCDSPANPGVLI